MVERYSMSIQGPFDRDPAELEPDNDGDWVRHSDYEALAAELVTVKGERNQYAWQIKQQEIREEVLGERLEAAEAKLAGREVTESMVQRALASLAKEIEMTVPMRSPMYRALEAALRGDAS